MRALTSDPPAFLHRRIAGCRTLSAAVWLSHGSAHEPADLAGATHLVEHLTLRRCGDRTRQQLSALVDRLGGEVEAWTSTEGMGITVHTTADASATALRLLRDAILEPSFDVEDVELERKVALAELEMVSDDPVDQVEEALLQAAWGEHPLARPIIGFVETLDAMTATKLRRHHAAMVQPGGILAAVVGDLDREDALQHLHGLPLGSVVRAPGLPPLTWQAGHRVLTRVSLDQVHVRLGMPALAVGDPAVSVLAILNRILGVGASSRLFQRLREDEGLTYDISSGLVLRGLGGLLEVGWVCAPGVLDEVHRLVREELVKLARYGAGDEEVEVAKESFARCLVMDAESPSGVCSMEMAEVLERGRRFDLDRSLAEVAAVQVAEVNDMAMRLVRLDTMASALCGPEGSAVRVA